MRNSPTEISTCSVSNIRQAFKHRRDKEVRPTRKGKKIEKTGVNRVRRTKILGLACLLSAIAIGPPALAEDSPAASYLTFESVSDGRCQILSEGGKLRIMHNRHPRSAIRFRLMRVFAGKPQGLSTGTAETGEQPTKLGCTRVDGREQDWIIERASYLEENQP